jgi:hypothetical protein
MNFGIIITTAILALELQAIKVDLEVMVLRLDMVHPLELVTIIIITTFEKERY